jgi:hypothetical protein
MMPDNARRNCALRFRRMIFLHCFAHQVNLFVKNLLLSEGYARPMKLAAKAASAVKDEMNSVYAADVACRRRTCLGTSGPFH